MGKHVDDFWLCLDDSIIFKVTMLCVGAISLISFGWLMGGSHESTMFVSRIWMWLKDVASIVGGFSTLAAAVIGYSAFSNWKKQFHYEKRYNAYIALEKALDDYQQSYKTYSEAYLWKLRLESGAFSGDDIHELVNDFSEYKSRWRLNEEALISAQILANSVFDSEIMTDLALELLKDSMKSLERTLLNESIDKKQSGDKSPQLHYRIELVLELDRSFRSIKEYMRENVHNKAFRTDSQRSAL
ncbi:hypothetical protein VCR12J2_640132 [Vibrio coralliirubri]|uniref:hypothetical protein n=1 Tax=Vibrio coralliirubri TaxID=1516159 RepID=UPI00062EB8EF|nr:hypothetical protein [Vibrio coralliirubri]CDU04327.1 hypothetical protein VCR12J2_640132 [Vibrio coralliirubri]